MDSESLYKTEICKFYKQCICLKGKTCKFAHGIEELRKRKCVFGKNCINNNHEHLNNFYHENYYNEETGPSIEIQKDLILEIKKDLLQEINYLKDKIKYLEIENNKLKIKNYDLCNKDNKYLLELIDKIGIIRDEIIKNMHIYNKIDIKKVKYSIITLNNFKDFLEETKKDYYNDLI